ncbi:MAG TPA: hypothetical protein VFM28_04600 [Nitrososphaeraceae archaeon]|nr:hypothetical protein [Nitrososphaeraceae archaeon]
MKITNIYFIVLLIIVIFPTIMAWAAEEKSNIINNSSSYSSSSSISLNNTNVDFATNIEFIKGHLSAAILNKQAGNNELAQTHTFHPINEIYTLIRDQLSSVDNELNNTLINSLKNLTAIVFTSSSAEFIDSASFIKNLLDKAIIKAIPENEIADIKFNMSILINLLKTAESEYDIGIENGTITNIAEYQDSQGFVSSANELLNKTINNVNQTIMVNKFTEIKNSLNKLNTSMNNKQDAKQISTIINNIANTIPNILNVQAKDLSILVSTDTESSELINNIRSLLEQSIEKIKNDGDYQNAETLVIEAYLDNFEFLEGEITKHDESLMKDTEVLLREQLRNLIQGKANAEDIQKMVNNINNKLNEIEKLLQ